MNRLARSFFALATASAPLALLAGWVILMATFAQPPDARWSLAHAFLILGVILFLPTMAHLKSLLGVRSGIWPSAATALTLVGAVGLSGQFAIDIAVAALSSSQAEMSALFSRLSADPTIRLPFYIVGPTLFYTGPVVLLSLLTAGTLISRWAGFISIAGIMAVGTGAFAGIPTLTLLGFVGLSLGFVAIAIQSLSNP